MGRETRLFLDVDGVLLIAEPAAAPFAREFLEFAVERFDCCRLTTHCRGDAEPVVEYLRPYFPEAILRHLAATDWGELETDALTGDFVWIDDAPTARELEALRARGEEHRLIRVDPAIDPDALLILQRWISPRRSPRTQRTHWCPISPRELASSRGIPG